MPGGAEAAIAVGDSFAVGGYSRDGSFVLTSDDGIDWRDDANLEDGGPGSALRAMATNGDVAVALLDHRGNGPSSITVDVSEDLVEWRAADDQALRRLPGAYAVGVTWTGDEFVAVGNRPLVGGESTGELVVGSSPDGVTWTTDPGRQIEFENFVAPVDISSQGELPVILAAAPDGTLATLIRPTADGLGWVADQVDALQFDRVTSLVGLRDDRVAIGGCRRSPDGIDHPMVWVGDQADEAWGAFELEGTDACILGLDGVPGGVVATGRDEAVAAAWLSTNGTEWQRGEPSSAFAGEERASAHSSAQTRTASVVVGIDVGSITDDPLETVAIWRKATSTP